MDKNLVLAILLPFLALPLQWLLWPWLTPFVWFLFYPTVFFSARLGSLWGGLISTVTSIVMVWYFFMPPQLSWALDNPSRLYSIGLFLIMGYLFSVTHQRLKLAQHNNETALEARFAAAFEQAAVGIAMLSPDGHWLRANQKLCEIVGYSHDELLARSFQDITYPDDLEVDCNYKQQLLQGSIQTYAIEKRYLRKDGGIVWANLTVSLVRHADGNPDYFVSVVEDIQQRKNTELALRQSQADMAKAQGIAHLGSWNYNLAGGWVTWSEEALRILRVAPGTNRLDTEALKDLIAPDDRPAIKAWVGACRDGQQPNDLVFRYLPPDGGMRYLCVRGELLGDAGQLPASMAGTIQDITEIKLAERAVQEGRLKLEAALASMSDAVFISDVAGHFIHFNDAFATFHKFKDKQECAITVAEYPDILDVFMADGSLLPINQWAVPRALRGETVNNVEYSLRRKDTGETWVGSYCFAPIRNDKGSIVGSVVTARDITGQKQTQEALRVSQERLLLALDASRDGLWDWDLRTGAVFRSHRYYEIVGRRREDDTKDFDFFKSTVHPDDLASVLATIEAHKQGKTPIISFDYRLASPADKTTWVRVKGQVVERDANGAPMRIVGILSDITEHKLAEAQIRGLNTDLERRVEERTAALIVANQELDAFAYAVSHDLRAPLRAMSGFSLALQEDYGGQLTGEASEYLAQINVAALKMGDLIDGLLVLSRSSRGELRLDTVDLTALANNWVAELKRNAPGRQVAVYIEPGLQTQGDARMIEAALRNLLDNAWKYTQHTVSPCIRFYSELRDGRRYFCVADNGAGFDMAYANKLFRPFQRLHRQDEFLGIGIGLATVQRIVHRHGGTIEAQGEIGKGAVFSFSLGQ
ncbi:MAG: PAS domain S-box protein [Methylococcales bacterium]|nr:PAS domain S-box protein [Methylococcales bacterium]